jgi:hypothetical protein
MTEHYNINDKGIITTIPTKEQIEKYQEIVAGYPTYKNKGIQWSQCSITEINAAVSALKGTRVLDVVGKYRTNLLVSCSCPKHGTNGFDKPVELGKLLNFNRGNGCSACKRESCNQSAGTKRRKPATKEEKVLAAKLYSEHQSYAKVAEIMGRSPAGVYKWLNPDHAKAHTAYEAKRRSDPTVRSHKRQMDKNYLQFDHGKAAVTAKTHKRRWQKLDAYDLLWMPDHADADHWGFIEVDMTQYLEYVDDRWPFTFADTEREVARRKGQQIKLAEISGEAYSLEHLVPLDHGGLHHPLNFANRSLTMNVKKGKRRVLSDEALFCRRLFGTCKGYKAPAPRLDNQGDNPLYSYLTTKELMGW